MLEHIAKNPADAVAIIDCHSGAKLTYGQLLKGAKIAGEEVAAAGGRGLHFLLSTNTPDFVTLYLGCLSSRLPVLLVDPDAPMEFLLETYQPACVLAPGGRAFDGYKRSDAIEAAPSYSGWHREGGCPVHPDLSVLLPTSGSTGSPKLVRLAERNVLANAVSIAEYLELGPGERAIQSLPMYYSYGLSVLNSHLVSGGTVVLTSDSFIRPEFWKVVDHHSCTSFAGIPYMYETLHRLRFDPARHSSLRTLTQAGGGLKPDLISHFHGLTTKVGMRFVVMYGQTEATARISYVPPGRLGEKIGTIGIAIPGGHLSLREIPGESMCEMIYRGPNVMMGYAECQADLALGDELKGELPTGDLAVQDGDGYFRLVGRLNRFAKLFGRRISLEDVERSLENTFKVPVAVVEGDNLLRIFMEGLVLAKPEEVVHAVCEQLAVPPKAIEIRNVEQLPRTGNGKKNYSALKP